MDWGKLGKIYVYFAIVMALMIELFNYDIVSGLGIISFCLFMTLFFLMYLTTIVQKILKNLHSTK